MKIIYCINLLMFLVMYFFASHIHAVQANDQLPVRQKELLVEVSSLNELPEEINNLLIKKYGKVADIGKRFNASCIFNLNEPSVGLRKAVLGKESAILNIAIGGFAMRYVELIFVRDVSGWHLQN